MATSRRLGDASISVFFSMRIVLTHAHRSNQRYEHDTAVSLTGFILIALEYTEELLESTAVKEYSQIDIGLSAFKRSEQITKIYDALTAILNV